MPGVTPFVSLRNVIFKLMDLCFTYEDEKDLEIITKKLSLQNVFSLGILESGKEVGVFKMMNSLLLPLFFFCLNSIAA